MSDRVSLDEHDFDKASMLPIFETGEDQTQNHYEFNKTNISQISDNSKPNLIGKYLLELTVEMNHLEDTYVMEYINTQKNSIPFNQTHPSHLQPKR